MQAQFDRVETLDPPLTRLVLELVLAQAETDEFVFEVQLDHNWARIYRGSGELDPSGFRVADLIMSDFGLLAPLSNAAALDEKRLTCRACQSRAPTAKKQQGGQRDP